MASPSAESINIRGMDCRVHIWNQESPKAVVVVFHGFLAHGKYPTVRYAAELLHSNGYTVFAADLPGHGESPGMRGYLASADQTVADGVTIAQHAKKAVPDKQLFLVGSSLGGCIALNVGMQMKDEIAGVMLLAPMLAIRVSPTEQMLLKGLSYLVPTLAVIPSSANDSAKQYRDPEKMKECDEDELTVSLGALRIGSASSCVELASRIQEKFKEVSCPFLCMVATGDVVVDNQGSMQLMDQAVSGDKTMKEYDALHGLLCEPKPLVDEIQRDLLDWISERTTS